MGMRKYFARLGKDQSKEREGVPHLDQVKLGLCFDIFQLDILHIPQHRKLDHYDKHPHLHDTVSRKGGNRDKMFMASEEVRNRIKVEGIFSGVKTSKWLQT